MDILDVSLVFSVLSCSLAAGFILTYAIVVMPGLSGLDDKAFMRAFQLTDGVIQNNQPVFMLIWLGSIISVSAAIVSSMVIAGLSEAWVVVLVGAVYLVGVQGITMSIHLPLNGRVQKLDIDNLDDQTLSEERLKIETKWNYFNNIRTAIAVLVSLSLLIILSLR